VGEQEPPPTGEQDAALARFRPGAVVLPAQVQVGQEIVAEATGWTPRPTGTTCLWSIGGEERDNLGSCAYTVALDDVGKAVQVQLTATRQGYAEAEAISNATATVPQPSVPRPSCSITLRPGEVNAGWLAHCGIEQDPNVTYTWTWVDIDSGETITQKGDAGYTVGPSMWIPGSHHGHRVTVTVNAQRAGYRSAEFSATSTMPDEWVPAE
jgi:predicted RNA-binding protein with TRAM domain